MKPHAKYANTHTLRNQTTRKNHKNLDYQINIESNLPQIKWLCLHTHSHNAFSVCQDRSFDFNLSPKAVFVAYYVQRRVSIARQVRDDSLEAVIKEA